MRINELITENQQLDELNLSGVGKGIGNIAGGVGKAIGGVAGGTVAATQRFGKGVKQGYQDAKASVGGTAAPAQQPAAQTSAAPAQQTTAQPAATRPTQQPAVAPTQATAPAQQPAAPAQNIVQPTQGRVGVPAGRKAVDQAVATIKQVRGDRRPQVVQYAQQQLATVKENKVGFTSNFLGIEI